MNNFKTEEVTEFNILGMIEKATDFLKKTGFHPEVLHISDNGKAIIEKACGFKLDFNRYFMGLKVNPSLDRLDLPFKVEGKVSYLPDGFRFEIFEKGIEAFIIVSANYENN